LVAAVGDTVTDGVLTGLSGTTLKLGEVAVPESVVVLMVTLSVLLVVDGFTTPATKALSALLAAMADVTVNVTAVVLVDSSVATVARVDVFTIVLFETTVGSKVVPVGNVTVTVFPLASAPPDDVTKAMVYPVVAPAASVGAAEIAETVTVVVAIAGSAARPAVASATLNPTIAARTVMRGCAIGRDAEGLPKARASVGRDWDIEQPPPTRPNGRSPCLSIRRLLSTYIVTFAEIREPSQVWRTRQSGRCDSSAWKRHG